MDYTESGNVPPCAERGKFEGDECINFRDTDCSQETPLDIVQNLKSGAAGVGDCWRTVLSERHDVALVEKNHFVQRVVSTRMQ